MPRIVAISDTHGHHDQMKKMPKGDILIVAGDISMRGDLNEISRFGVWLQKQRYAVKLVSFGNHELNHDKPGKKKDDGIKIIQNCGGIYLEHESVVIDGFRIWLSPASPWFYDWAWNYQRGAEIAAIWAKIPDDTNVIAVHGPPYGIFDRVERDFCGYENVGCKDLAKRISELKQLKVCLSGHIHKRLDEGPITINGVQYANVSICNNKYKVTNMPTIIDL